MIVEDCHEPNKGALCLGTPCFAKVAPEGPAGAAWRENFLEIWNQNLTTPLFQTICHRVGPEPSDQQIEKYESKRAAPIRIFL